MDATDKSVVIYQQIQTALGYFAHRFRSRDEMAELAHEAYLKIMARHERQPIENLDGYIYETARNLSLRGSRPNAKLQEIEDIALPEQKTSPLEYLLREERKSKLEAAIDALPPKCKEVFVLHKIQGLSYSQVAANLGISQSMVEKHMSKALRHCVAALRGLYP